MRGSDRIETSTRGVVWSRGSKGKEKGEGGGVKNERGGKTREDEAVQRA